MTENLTSISSSLFLVAAGFLILVLLFLARFWIRHRSASQRTVSSILKSASIPEYRESLDCIRDELARVRRYQRTLSVVVLRLNGLGPHGEINATETGSDKSVVHKNQKNGSRDIEFLLRASLIRDFMRGSDITTYDEATHQFTIVMPETSKIQAARAARRFKETTGKGIADDMNVGISEFPGDGLVIEQLVLRAIGYANDPTIDQLDVDLKRESSH